MKITIELYKKLKEQTENPTPPEPQQPTKIGKIQHKQRGRPRIEPKDLSEYFIGFEKDRVPIFINALKETFIDSTTKDIVYLIQAMKNLNYISFKSDTEIFRAIENAFGKSFGTQQARNKITLNDKTYLSGIEDRLKKIKQENNVY